MSHFEEQIKDMKKIIKNIKVGYDTQGNPNSVYIENTRYVLLFYDSRIKKQWVWYPSNNTNMHSDDWRDMFYRIRNDKNIKHFFTYECPTLSEMILGRIIYEREHEDYV